MCSKLFIGVEYDRGDGETTYEIFDSMKSATEFGATVTKTKYFVADFNLDYVFREENGQWNYDDNSALYGYWTPLDLKI